MFKTPTVHKEKSQCHNDDQNMLKCPLSKRYKCKFFKHLLSWGYCRHISKPVTGVDKPNPTP